MDNRQFAALAGDYFRPTTLAAMIDDLLEHDGKELGELLFAELVTLVGTARALNFLRTIDK